MRKRAIQELEEIAAKTAELSGVMRQFEMSSSTSYEPNRRGHQSSDEARLLGIQEHIETLYGMVQRIAFVLAEEWEAEE